MMKILHIFTLTLDIKNPLYEFEDGHQQMFLPKFHGNSTSPGGREGVDSSFNAGDFLPLKLNQLPSDFHETLERRSAREYFQICTRVFRYLPSKVRRFMIDKANWNPRP